jgi:hypothetical protein
MLDVEFFCTKNSTIYDALLHRGEGRFFPAQQFDLFSTSLNVFSSVVNKF